MQVMMAADHAAWFVSGLTKGEADLIAASLAARGVSEPVGALPLLCVCESWSVRASILLFACEAWQVGSLTDRAAVPALPLDEPCTGRRSDAHTECKHAAEDQAGSCHKIAVVGQVDTVGLNSRVRGQGNNDHGL